MSRVVTAPSGPTSSASSAAFQPAPAPTFSTRCPGAAPSCSSMIATIDGWETELTVTPSSTLIGTATSA
nr:hypothetical protein [Pseudonocardia sp. ICBG601]